MLHSYKSFWYLVFALLPAYISLAIVFGENPETSSSSKLSSLLRLSKANQLLKHRLGALSSASSSAIINRQHSTSAYMSSTLKMIPLLSQDRGHADHDWLKTFHTFSFAMYQDFNHEKYGPLRVINEDRVAPKTGFGTHSHREFEIFSYVVKGALEHKDSMGNTEILKRGAVQLTSAGTGISHSEKAHGSEEVHFLQIWSLPHTSRLTPKYFTREFTDAEKLNKFVPVVAPAGSEGVIEERNASGPAPVQTQLTLYASLVEAGKKVKQKLTGKKGYVHLIQTGGYNPGKASGGTIRVGSGETQLELREGDGAYLTLDDTTNFTVENVGDSTAEVLLFDIL